jgi:biopolymer transport protein ExbB
MDWLQRGLLQLDEYLRAGGPVMLPLFATSLVMWVLIVDRALFFRRLCRNTMPLPTALAHVVENRMPDPERYGGAISLLLARFIPVRSGDRVLDRFLLDETVTRIDRSLDDYLALIGVLAAVAPCLGLLGTVTGMISTFDVLAVFGTGNARAMAGGIAEALITTQTGLLVAIPGLYLKGLLERRARTLRQRLSSAGLFLKRQL